MTRTSLKILITAGFIGSAVFSTQAIAKDPDVYFYPQKSWTLNSGETAAGNTCQISNTFNNGFVFQLNGSEEWVKTIQIDFKQPSFEAGKTYDVKLSVPGVKQKTVQGQALNPNILSLDIASHKDFYKAARNSSVFDFEIDQNEFRFYMVGFANSALEFERCMSGAKELKKKEDLQTAQQEKAEEEAKTGLKVTRADLAPEMADPMVNETIEFETAERTGNQIEEIIPADPVPEIEIQEVETIETTGPEPISRPDDSPRKRLSDMLAEQIAKNPEIAAIDQDESNPGLTTTSETAKTTPQEAQAVAALPKEPKMLPLPTPAKTENTVDVKNIEEAPALPPGSEPEKVPPVETVKLTDETEETDIKIEKKTRTVEADLRHVNPPPSDKDKLYKENRELRQKLLKLEREKQSLNEELDLSLQEGQQEHVQITSENWDLERATMRYQEAERQTKRLAQQLQQERARWQLEKEELEAMLFDPQVTNAEQLAKLSELNRQLQNMKQEMEAQRLRYEERIRLLEKYAATQP